MKRCWPKKMRCLVLASLLLAMLAGLLLGCESTSAAATGSEPSSLSEPHSVTSEQPAGKPLSGPAEGPEVADGTKGAEGSAQAALFVPPEYAGLPTAVVNGDKPFFTDEQLAAAAAAPGEVSFSALDDLGRCGAASACVGLEIMPDGERGPIAEIIPSGWRNCAYPWVDQEYVYNRCHLLAWALGGGNAEPRNLITGTRTMNTKGMLPVEFKAICYIEATGNHVLYRVTPVFEGEELVARGVLMEVSSVEDGGEGLSLCRWCFNVEPGVEIDYATGENRSDGTMGEVSQTAAEGTWILNIRSMKFHRPDCDSVADMSERNKQEYTGSRDELLELGYEPCGRCNP